MRRVLASSPPRTDRRIASFITPPFRATASSRWLKASASNSTSYRDRKALRQRTSPSSALKSQLAERRIEGGADLDNSRPAPFFISYRLKSHSEDYGKRG